MISAKQFWNIESRCQSSFRRLIPQQYCIRTHVFYKMSSCCSGGSYCRVREIHFRTKLMHIGQDRCYSLPRWGLFTRQWRRNCSQWVKVMFVKSNNHSEEANCGKSQNSRQSLEPAFIHIQRLTQVQQCKFEQKRIQSVTRMSLETRISEMHDIDVNLTPKIL